MNKKINCTVDDKNIILPKYETPFASGMDLRAWKYSIPDDLSVVHDFGENGYRIPPHQRVLIKTGLHIELPENIEAQIRPRSGLSLKSGIVAQLGTIDEDYRGDLGIILLNTTDDFFHINKGDRLGQIVFSKVEKFDLNVVDELSKTLRGENGFNSTGIK